VRQIGRRARNNNYRRPLIIVALFATHLAARGSLGCGSSGGGGAHPLFIKAEINSAGLPSSLIQREN